VERIISEIAENFIKNLFVVISGGGKLSEIEDALLMESKSCASKIVGVYVEAVDSAIVSDKVSRKELGYTIERRKDERRVQSLVGEISYSRTYFKKASGGYEYLTDIAIGVEARSRVSDSLSLALVQAAKDMSYAKSSNHISNGEISRQTVMGRVRQSCAVPPKVEKRLKVPVLHIDADEAHVTLCGGKNTIVPLISVYEGVETKGNRRFCKNIFHISEYGKTPDDLWEQVLTEIERRYDITNTEIYLHGDGAKWIKTCYDWLPKAIFVLDKYHKNKAIKNMTAGLGKELRKQFDLAIRQSLAEGDRELFANLADVLCEEHPERKKKIQDSSNYLYKFADAISICENDPSSNNGGCTEPHISHILSARLSTRPMAWSKQTLKQLAPILAAGKSDLQKVCSEIPELPKPLVKTANHVNKSFSRKIQKWSLGMPRPDAIGTLPISGKTVGTQVLLKLFK
jgi:hypothetical protein